MSTFTLSHMTNPSEFLRKWREEYGSSQVTSSDLIKIFHQDPKAKLITQFSGDVYTKRTLSIALKKASNEPTEILTDEEGRYRLSFEVKKNVHRFTLNFEQHVQEEASKTSEVEISMRDFCPQALLDRSSVVVDSTPVPDAEIPQDEEIQVQEVETTEIAEPINVEEIENEEPQAQELESDSVEASPIALEEVDGVEVQTPCEVPEVPVVAAEGPVEDLEVEEVVLTPKNGLLDYLGVPYGLTISKDLQSLAKNPEEQGPLVMIHALGSLGFSESSIAKGLNVDQISYRGREWSSKEVNGVLKTS